MGTPHRNIAPRLPLPFFTQMLAFPTWNLLFCSPDFWHSCSVNYVRFFPPQETGVRESVEKKNLHHHSAKHIWHTSAPHCPFSGHTTLMETCPLWQRHSVTDWHLSGGQHGAFTSDLLDFIGILGMLGFFLLHTPFYFLGLLALVEAKHLQRLPPFLVGKWCICYWLVGLPGILGMLSFLLHTTFFFLGLLVLMELLKV